MDHEQWSQHFSNWDEAIEFIHNYARESGFQLSIKETRYQNPTKSRIQSIRFHCSRGGKAQEVGSSSNASSSRKRTSQKCNCPFSITFVHNEAYDHRIEISSVRNQHNHPLLTPEEQQAYANKKRSRAQKKELRLLALTSLTPKQIQEYLNVRFANSTNLSYKTIYNDITALRSSEDLSTYRELSVDLATTRYEMLLQRAREFCMTAAESEASFEAAKAKLMQYRQSRPSGPRPQEENEVSVV